MSEASFASLNPALLARKGGAKPAMRPQLHPLPESVQSECIDPEQLEDLGWNDMGAESAEPIQKSAQVLHLTPATAEDSALESEIEETAPLQSAAPAAGKASVSPENQSHDEIVAAAKRARKATDAPAARKIATGSSGRRAAFTLRLDTDRHLKLRLAATMQGQSAQALVTKALDHMFSQIDDLDALAQRMKQT